jgi:hypothetical protein
MNRLPNLGGYTPSDLQDMGMSVLLYFSPLTLTAPSTLIGRGLGEGESPVSRLQEPASDPLTLTPPRIANRRTRKPRSKASHLPPDIQLSLNTMLANGCAYRDIIRTLNAQGYSGFNKVNLHNWKATGYQQWLRSKTQEAIT